MEIAFGLPCHGRGRGFESRRSRHFINDLAMILRGKNCANLARKTGLWRRP
jgi:hypothetical protein